MFMLLVALIGDMFQFLLNLADIIPVLGFAISLLAILVTFFEMCIFGVWFAIMGINYFSGKKSGMKTLSAFGSLAIEAIPLLDALPGITMGVLGIIISSRLEEKAGSAKEQGGKAVDGVKARIVRNVIKFSPEAAPLAAAASIGGRVVGKASQASQPRTAVRPVSSYIKTGSERKPLPAPGNDNAAIPRRESANDNDTVRRQEAA